MARCSHGSSLSRVVPLALFSKPSTWPVGARIGCIPRIKLTERRGYGFVIRVIGYPVSMSDRPDDVVTLPRPMEAISDDRVKLVQMLDSIEASADPVERADLAMALVELAAKYQNIEEEALFPTLDGDGCRPTLDRAQADQRVVREALTDMHRADPARETHQRLR